ncbi:MAG: PfkB family carbohydrate kinase [Kiritimatiellae bacterium]|nr:PfkB family carbohydrate kinase [Kiritimatiellia bacterium]MDD5520236.1 PfkB family carbohydrate kinase [Kiritimatiellia bacterium]
MISVERAKKIMGSFKDQKILVVGDMMLDRYVYGVVNRISPEAPVPVVLVTEENNRPGGAANVALNIQSLGGQAIVAGIAGKDKEGEELISALTCRGIFADGLLTSSHTKTIVKTRIMADRQQVVRVDKEDPPEATAALLNDFCKRISELAGEVNGIIIEDYGKGVVCQEVVDTILRVTSEEGIPVGFDPKDNCELKISGITIATPNYKEAMIAAGLSDTPLSGDPINDARLKKAGDILMKKWHPQILIITLGAHGMYLINKGDDPRFLPAKAREVFDVCGAGDTVIATVMLAHATGADYYESASIANYAAGVVVGKVGTATCTPTELLNYIE